MKEPLSIASTAKINFGNFQSLERYLKTAHGFVNVKSKKLFSKIIGGAFGCICMHGG
jgi:hypothetical protein